MGFKFNQRYDLRMKDTDEMRVRDSFAGARLTDTKETAQLKKRLARGTAIIAALAVFIGFVCWIAHLLDIL